MPACGGVRSTVRFQRCREPREESRPIIAVVSTKGLTVVYFISEVHITTPIGRYGNWGKTDNDCWEKIDDVYRRDAGGDTEPRGRGLVFESKRGQRTESRHRDGWPEKYS